MELRSPEGLKKRRQLHVSAVNMFNRCGMQFAFRYIQGIRRPPNAFMICGTATDKAVNWDLDTMILEKHLAKLTDLTDLAADAVDTHPHLFDIKLDPDDAHKGIKKVIGETKDKAVRLVTTHHQLIAPQIVPFRTARKFTVNLDEFLRVRAELVEKESDMPDLSAWRSRVMKAQAQALREVADEGIDFVGEQDIVEKYARPVPISGEPLPDVLNIRDTKTSGKSKNQNDVDNDDQLTAYATASMVVDQRLPSELIFDVLVDLKTGVKPQIIRTKRDVRDVDVFLNRVANAVSSMQQGIFVPTNQTNWWCAEKWCAYTEHCPYFRKTRRPEAAIVDDLTGKLDTDDMLPILNKSVVLARKVEDDDAIDF